MKRILIAGIGNIFLGDDAFGVEVAREILQRALPPEAQGVDFGIRGYDLVYALTDGFDAAILVDATVRGAAPGTVYLIELDRDQLGALENASVDAHNLNPLHVLQLAQRFGELPEALYLVGCEPAQVDSPDGQLGLSEDAAAAVPQAIEKIESLLARLLNSRTKRDPGCVPV
jgi:hydrogenase maturation protease